MTSLKSFSIALLILVFTLILPLTAKGALIEADAFETADNKGFTLNLSGYNLLWLDPVYTLQMSLQEVEQYLNSGLQAAGWRPATVDEVVMLFSEVYGKNSDPGPCCFPGGGTVVAYLNGQFDALWRSYNGIFGLEGFYEFYIIGVDDYGAVDSNFIEFVDYHVQLNDTEYHTAGFATGDTVDELYGEGHPVGAILLVKNLPIRNSSGDTPIPESSTILLLMLGLSVSCAIKRLKT